MKIPAKAVKRQVLVVDVGGTHIKVLASRQNQHREVASGPRMTAPEMVVAVRKFTRDWSYDVVAIGYPGPVLHGCPVREPHNLGGGWVGFNFRHAFRRPVRLMNDAAMQAIGSYRGGRMLFLGLGTGLGTALIAEGVLEPMELAHLPYRNGQTYEDFIGIRGLLRLGEHRWHGYVLRVAVELRQALGADYIVFGGGNSHRLHELPPKMYLGDNDNAFIGGFRLWGQHMGRIHLHLA